MDVRTPELSINFPPFALRTMGEVARAAEAAGFDALRLGDMQSTHRELYTALTVIAGHTRRVAFGPGVTNPITRHPAVAASAIATLHEYSGGRAVFAIGAGDSAVHNVGGRSATIAELEEYITAIRDLHTTGRARYRDRDLALDWWAPQVIPIAVSAHGPRMLQLAGRVADAVVIGVGMGALAREYAAEHVARGAREAGRDPAEITMWHMSYLNLAGDPEGAAAQVGSALAVGGNLLARSAAHKIIPAPLKPRFTELAARYSYIRHAGGNAGNPNAALIEELHLVDYLADQFGVFGDADDVRARLNTLAQSGVSHLWGSYVLPDITDFFARWEREVASHKS